MSSDQTDRPPAPAGSLGPDMTSAEGPADQVPRTDQAPPSGREASTESAHPRAGLAGPLVVYSLLRLGLIAILTAVLSFFMPLIVALLFAIIVQLPLAYVLFAGPRKRVNSAMAGASAQRRAERDRLKAALSGEPPPGRPAG